MVEKITTTKGLMDPAKLRRVDGGVENDHESTKTVEYYLGDELVHRSAHVTLKRLPSGFGQVGKAG